MKTFVSKVLSFFIIVAILITPIIAAAPTSTAKAAGTNLIVNGDFSGADANPWWAGGATPPTNTINSGVLNVSVPSGTGNFWDTITGQNDIPLTNGVLYTYSFDAWASAPVSMQSLIQRGSDPWTTYFNTNAIALTAAPKHFSYTFTIPVASPSSGVQFQVGGNGGAAYTVYLDNISLMATTQRIVNGDFSGADANPWWAGGATPPTNTVNSGVLNVSVPSGTGNFWDTITGQNDIPLTSGVLYTYSFDAWASAPVSMQSLIQRGSDPWTTYFNTNAIALTTTPQHFSYTFTMPVASPSSGVQFQVGGNGGAAYTVYLDNISLTEPAGPPPPSGPPPHIGELLKNGTFSGGNMTDWWATSSVTAAVAQKRLEATITNGGSDPWDAIVGQNSIPVFDTTGTPGNQYTVTVKAWASASTTVSIILENYNQPLALTTTPKTFTFDFDMNTNAPAASFQFQMGGQGNHVVYFDNVSLNGPEPVSHMASGTSLLVNGDFESGTNPWWKAGPDSWDASSGEMVVTIPVGTGNTWDDGIGQDNVSLLQGGSYTLDFEAWADDPSPITPVNVLTLIQKNSHPWTAYFTSGSGNVPLTSTPQPFHFAFTSGVTDPSAGFQFPLGANGAFTFHVDNVVLLGPKPTPPTKFLTGVRVNQTGYLPNAPKVASVVTDLTTAQPWTLYNSSNVPVATGTTTIFGADQASGEVVQHADFSSFTTPGTGYYLEVYGEQSYPFDIATNVYSLLKYDSLAYFYQTRSGIEIAMPYAGQVDLTHPAGHLDVAPNLGDTNVACYDKLDNVGHQWTGCSYNLDVSKGWYDAGDYGKYVVNGGIAVWTLLNQYERARYLGRNHLIFGDGGMNIPENNNGVPDLLDEVRWELEFMLSMQVPPGGMVEGVNLSGMVHHKIHDEFWTGLGHSPDQDEVQRYLYPPSTAATLNMAAVAAQCARIWATIDAAFSAECLDAAETAWTAALAHPTMETSNDFNGGGGYGDPNATDEFYWAASELFITTGNATYQTYITNDATNYLEIPTNDAISGILVDDSFGWPNTTALGNISLAIVPNTLPAADVQTAQDNIIAAADGYAANIPLQGYQLPYRSESGLYWWGSNSSVLNNMLILGLAYDFTAQAGYFEAVSQGMDYLLGRNPNVKSYVSGYGEDPMLNPHHRFWAPSIDPFPAPPPGVLAGGPNSNMDDPYIRSIFPDGCNDAPQKCYVDHLFSYSTNEVAINWNAPLAWVAAFMDDVADTQTTSGNTGVGGATLSYTDGIARTATADANGDYIFSVSSGWSGTVTPAKTGFSFTPASRTYTNVQANLTGQNYSAILTLMSNGAQDGLILESHEESGVGGQANANSTLVQLGDSSDDRQYKVILSFNTAALPDNAIIQSVKIKIKQSGTPTGSNPFNVLGKLWADIRKGTFGAAALQLGDFSAAASATNVGAFNKTPVSGWYTATLSAAGRSKINKTGVTQIRLFFQKDDNDNGRADLMKFLSGNAIASNRPQFIITFTRPAAP